MLHTCQTVYINMLGKRKRNEDDCDDQSSSSSNSEEVNEESESEEEKEMEEILEFEQIVKMLSLAVPKKNALDLLHSMAASKDILFWTPKEEILFKNRRIRGVKTQSTKHLSEQYCRIGDQQTSCKK